MGVFFDDLSEVEEGDSQRLGNLGDGFFVLSGEPTPALFVEELEDAHQVFVVGDDRVGQDLFRLEAGAFVVGRVVEQGRMDRIEFGDVIGIGNIDWAEIFGAETSEALFGNRDADFFDAVDMRDFGENFLFFRIEREQGQIFCIEQTEDVFMQVEENLVEIAGRMNLVRDALDVLRECRLLLQFLEILRDRLGVHPTCLLRSKRECNHGCTRISSAHEPCDQVP